MLAPAPTVAAPMSKLRRLPAARRLAPPALTPMAVPEVRPVMEIDSPMPVVALLAVKLNMPVPV